MNNEIDADGLGEWLGVSKRSVTEMAKKGIVIKAARGRYLLKESVRSVLRHQREIAAGRGGTGQVLDLTAERARLAKEQADAQSIKNSQLRGELLPADEVEREVADMIRRARSSLLAVPARLAQDGGFTADQIEQADKTIRIALNDLADGKGDPQGHGGLPAAAETEALHVDGEGVTPS